MHGGHAEHRPLGGQNDLPHTGSIPRDAGHRCGHLDGVRLTPTNYTLSPYTFVAAEACPAARVYRGPKRETSQANWHGIAIHLFLQYAQERGRDFALGYIGRKFKRLLPFCAEIDLSQIPEGVCEPQFVIDTAQRTSVLLDKHDNVRAITDPKDHVIVRGDLLAKTSDNIPWVIDFKTGKDNKTEPSTSHQSMLEALGTALHEGASSVRASVFNVVRGEIRQRHHTFDAVALEEISSRVRRVHLAVIETRNEFRQEGVEPERNPGAWCRSCQAANVCTDAKYT
jgi:hypothetical protein